MTYPHNLSIIMSINLFVWGGGRRDEGRGDLVPLGDGCAGVAHHVRPVGQPVLLCIQVRPHRHVAKLNTHLRRAPVRVHHNQAHAEAERKQNNCDLKPQLFLISLLKKSACTDGTLSKWMHIINKNRIVFGFVLTSMRNYFLFVCRAKNVIHTFTICLIDSTCIFIYSWESYYKNWLSLFT